MTDEYLGVNVTRSISNESNTGIVDEVMQRKDEIVSDSIDGDLAYRASVYGHGESAEEAFSDVYQSSKLTAYLSPDLEEDAGINPFDIDTADLSEPEQILSPVEVRLGADVRGTEEHIPAIQKGVEALDAAGFEPYVEVMATYPDDSSRRSSAQEVIEGIEDQSLHVEVLSRSNPVNDHPDAHYMTSEYHPESQSLEPNASVCGPAHGTEKEAAEINRRMEEAFDEVGLLE